MFYVSRPADLVLESVGLNHAGRLILRMYNAGAAIPDEHFQTSGISVKAGGNTYKIPLRTAAKKTLQLPRDQVLWVFLSDILIFGKPRANPALYCLRLASIR